MKAFKIAVVILVLLFSAAIGWISYWNESDVAPVYGDTDGEKNGFVYIKADASEDGYTTVYVPEGEDFRILTLTDPQVKYPVNNYEKFGASNENTYIFVERLVKAADPDLVVITGDIVMSQFTNNLKYLKRWANLFESLDVYWTPSFGNHDSEFTLGSGSLAENLGLGQSGEERVTEVLSQYPHCLAEYGDAGENAGGGNYFINIRNHDGSLRYTLTIADTVNGVLNKYLRYQTAEQTAWYERHIREINASEYGQDAEIKIKNMMFTHVPLPEVFTAYEAWENGDASVSVSYGYIMEGSAKSAGFEKSTTFDKIKELGATTAVFFGHNHHNDAMVTYEGIDLVFVQHSGLAHYYRIAADNKNKTLDMTNIYRYGDARGGTLITIDEDREYTVEQFLAKDNIEYDDIRIDYGSVRNDLEEKGWTIIDESGEN